MQESMSNNLTKENKHRKRVIFVLLFLVMCIVIGFINLRGEYLQILEIGQQYVSTFEQNIKYYLSVAIINFTILYFSIYVTTKFIKSGLKKFFIEEKREIPKLPNKSIALILGIVVTVITTPIIAEKAILALNVAWFGIPDPIFGMDLGYYMFQKPFVEFIVYYIIALVIGLSIYLTIYYIVAFNVYFDGIDVETLKKNTFIKQLVVNASILAVALGTITFIKSSDILFANFMTLDNDLNTSLAGAGFVDVTIKLWGYRVLGIIITLSILFAIYYIRKADKKKTIFAILAVPVYLVALFIITIVYNWIFVGTDELGRQKQYIGYNIENTKQAYNINIEEKQLKNSGTITIEEVERNQNIINNIPVVDQNVTLTTLKEYQSNVGYYSFKNTKIANYNDLLVYITPREIINNNSTLSSTNKTYEYTHGYSAIITSAVSTDEVGNIEYIQSDFENENNAISITQPRIYFGLETNATIITNTKTKKEFDYPITTTVSANNIYDGKAGLQLGILDRIVLGIKEKNVNISFGIDMTNESKVLPNRNIIERAKKVLPTLMYDENPYLVIKDDGKLVWVLDAYTTSNKYPYSTSTTIYKNGLRTDINYIRNSAKVLIDAYDGTVEFYITDRNDPIIMAYNKIYPDIFLDFATLSEDIKQHLVYSEYLYNIQANILTTYHNVQPEVLYRSDDIWETTTFNLNLTATSKNVKIEPCYTMVKQDDMNILGLVLPYTQYNKKNIVSYLVGTNDMNGTDKLVMYKFTTDNNVLGPTQLERQIEEDETISKEITSINLAGTRIVKNILIVPIENTLLYVEPVYQVLINESQVPVLKKVIVASGNKLAIGNNLQEALKNLLSQYAVNIEVENTDDVEGLIDLIIKANNNLNASNDNNDWELVGKDIARLQELITQLEKMKKEQDEQRNKDNQVVEKNNVNVIDYIENEII